MHTLLYVVEYFLNNNLPHANHSTKWKMVQMYSVNGATIGGLRRGLLSLPSQLPSLLVLLSPRAIQRVGARVWLTLVWSLHRYLPFQLPEPHPSICD